AKDLRHHISGHAGSCQACREGEGKRIQDEAQGLRKYINNLVQSGYVTKSSSKAFDENFDEFVQGTKTTLDGLDGMGDYLTMAADKFEQIDEELAKQARK
ncbi:WXG100 family type VII secretion target, partial [Streptomyces afghaniensis]|uniref:WXG100 family type VII secretion target n=1 Tax=Streptomyces afghaniensis TaxID=66865 RepID=UPI0024689DF9